MTLASGAGTGAIALMFFLQGARLAPQAALAGARHWRLHAVVLSSTFLLFPALGLTARAIAPGLLTPPLWGGLLMLCLLPSTVQSSIAFTSIARGNVAAALCAATASNLFGILLTPLLAGLLLQRAWRLLGARVGDVVLQLMLPFAAGQLARTLIANGSAPQDPAQPRRSRLDPAGGLCRVQRGRDARHLAPARRGALRDAAAAGRGPARRGAAGDRRDQPAARVQPGGQITIVFCGSKKSLASGLPMASVLFAGQPVGLIILPLMLFHQIQLMACAALARRYAAQTSPRVGARVFATR